MSLVMLKSLVLSLLGKVPHFRKNSEATKPSAGNRARPSQEEISRWLQEGLQKHHQRDFEGAKAAYLDVLQYDENNPDALHLLGMIAYQKDDYDRALELINRAISFNQYDPDFYNNCGEAFLATGRVNEAINCYKQAVQLRPAFLKAHSNLLFALSYYPYVKPEAVLAEHRRWSKRQELPLAGAIKPHPNRPDPLRRLKVGYVSPDFRRHAVAYFIEPILANHDHAEFEVFCYDNWPNPDSMTQRFQGYADHWRSIAQLDDDALADLVRKDGIDILVDLSGHTYRHRMLLFARKPAPLQVTYLGYPNTTGLAAMDYRVTDVHADPVGMTDGYYTEKLMRFPDSMWCYCPPDDMPEVNPLPALQNGHVTFGSFNHLAKVTPEAIAVWSRLLRAVPGSRLIMAPVAEGETRLRVTRAFEENGISGDHLELLGKIPADQYLQLRHRVDIALDSFPCNGGTTTCETLWMGVPVITLSGRTFVSRAGLSLLTNLGLPELIAHTPEEYVSIATRLVNDRERLQALRSSLRQRMAHSPLTDAQRITRNLEQAFRSAWVEWCQGESSLSG